MDEIKKLEKWLWENAPTFGWSFEVLFPFKDTGAQIVVYDGRHRRLFDAVYAFHEGGFCTWGAKEGLLECDGILINQGGEDPLGSLSTEDIVKRIVQKYKRVA